MNIHEVMEYGYIVASSEELDILITVNGAYYNIWAGNYNGKYTNTDCRATDFDGLYGQDMVKVTDKAQQILEEILNEDNEEQKEEEE